jgi:hypothetical protein
MPCCLDGRVQVSEPDTYDLRYFSVSTADSIIPQPTIDGIDGTTPQPLQLHNRPKTMLGCPQGKRTLSCG